LFRAEQELQSLESLYPIPAEGKNCKALKGFTPFNKGGKGDLVFNGGPASITSD